MMRIGTVSQAVQDRTVLRPFILHAVYRPYLSEEDGWTPGISRSAGGFFTGPAEPSLQMVLAEAVNRIAAEGGRNIRLQLLFHVPDHCEEEAVKAWTETAACFAAAHDLPVTEVHAAISSALLRPSVYVTAQAGTMPDEKETAPPGGIVPEKTVRAHCRSRQEADEKDRFLLMSGYAGYAGTALLAGLYKEQLLQRFPAFLYQTGLSFGEDTLVTEQAALLHRYADAVDLGGCMSVGEGGVFAALWQFARERKAGFDISLRQIPIRQETIEICERADVNPYQLYGTGALLFTAGNGKEAVRLLKEAGFHASLLGRMTGGKAMILRNGEETRYLEKPQQDMLCRIREKLRQ